MDSGHAEQAGVRRSRPRVGFLSVFELDLSAGDAITVPFGALVLDVDCDLLDPRVVLEHSLE
jgi:hypothetical protein